MNPLKVIAEWFDQQDASIKGDFVGMAAHFLLDNSIELEFDMDVARRVGKGQER